MKGLVGWIRAACLGSGAHCFTHQEDDHEGVDRVDCPLWHVWPMLAEKIFGESRVQVPMSGFGFGGLASGERQFERGP
jgi:hypothetical protein